MPSRKPDDRKRLLRELDRRMPLLGFSDRSLSRAAGLSADAVRNIRRGSMPNSSTLAAIAGPLGSSVDELLGRGGGGTSYVFPVPEPNAGRAAEDEIIYDPAPRLMSLLAELELIDRASVRALRDLALDRPKALDYVRVLDGRAALIRAALRRTQAQGPPA